MTRLPEVTRGAVAEELRDAFDALIADSGGEVPQGPGAVTALSPEMALRRRPLSNYVRWELTLPQHVQELAILATARQMDCPYVWNAHAPLARKAGVSAELVDAMRERSPLPAMDVDESAVVTFVTEMLSAHRVPHEAYDAAIAQFGVRQTVDLVALVGQYVTNSCFLNAFEVALPETEEPLLPV
ncbi:MAG: carboxymuconolactone decarboxylase family protein [Chloroflexi bacterium]|nr:carboxymuconolactone decarboxylase family protein [Chloroflexota bacterium]